MFDTWPLLSLVTFLPLVGAALILLLVSSNDQDGSATTAKILAMWVSGVTFVLSLALWLGFDRSTADYQFVETLTWIPALGISYKVGVDGISVLFVLLSTLLTPVAILASWDAIKTRVRDYMVAFLLLETLMVGTFSALDIFLFYIFFEAVLIPMFLIIGIWGGENRVYASYKFFLYTLLGSILMLVAMLVVYRVGGSSDIPTLQAQLDLPANLQIWLWLAFFASFAVKIPMWPVHTWLPDAHVQAPTAGSVILAGVLLKMGGYGFLRFSLPFFPDASLALSPLVFGLSIVAVVYASLVALVQEDMKKLIAYSSVGHMAFVTAGIWAFNQQGIDGAIFQMLSHGIVSAALFLCVGVVYDRLHTRRIDAYGGVANTMPHYAIAFMIFMLASVGLPGTSGFVGEFLVLVGLFQTSIWVTAFMATGLILGATYMLWLYRKVIFGAMTSDNVKALLDLDLREKIVLYPLIVLVFWMGIYPKPILDITSASVAYLVLSFQAAVGG
jgi:NADH-quinone oxidoreductase subunit M